MNKLEILKAASTRLKRDHPNLKLLILFGSRARDDADPSSDWDFAFLYDPTFPKPEKPFWFPSSDILDTLSTLLNIADDDIDLVDLSHCSEMLAHFKRIDRLKKFEQLTLEEYLQDNLRQAAIERLIEIVIDSALSINKTLLKRVAGIVPPETSKSFKNFDSFVTSRTACTIWELSQYSCPPI
jgi:predicted nucleotidyltransferase